MRKDMENQEIKELRKKMKLSQEAFAQKVGVSFFTISRWERTGASPSKLAIEKLKQMKAEHERS
jgi:putative transcriptional regulator